MDSLRFLLLLMHCSIAGATTLQGSRMHCTPTNVKECPHCSELSRDTEQCMVGPIPPFTEAAGVPVPTAELKQLLPGSQQPVWQPVSSHLGSQLPGGSFCWGAGNPSGYPSQAAGVSGSPATAAPPGSWKLWQLERGSWPGVAGSLAATRVPGFPVAVLLLREPRTPAGHFWHITDLHLDPEYKVVTDPLGVCPSAGSQPVPNAGIWGNYLCDSPWILINSSIYAMKEILPDPDFILWTGDDTPHVPNEKLGEEAVLQIIARLTALIKQVFPDTKVYPAMGNHDFHPKSQFPAEAHRIYNVTAELWHSWLNSTSIPTFKAGAFYSEKLLAPNTKGKMVILNTNLYYDNNDQTSNMEDPGGQFQWLEDVLTSASKAGEMVYIVGHVPPGFFEKKRSKPWFRKHFNKRYTEIVQKHHGVIAAQFFGHHHTDSFRMFYSDGGSPINTLFLAPGVTPWKTTLPGVHNGANNPGIRVFDYDRGTLQVKDVVTYYLNLTHANLATPRWEKEYRLTDAFQVPDGSARSMHMVLEKISKDKHFLQQYYQFNSVRYDLAECDEGCQTDHICAIKEVDFTKYEECLNTRNFASVSALPANPLFFLCSLLGILSVHGHLW